MSTGGVRGVEGDLNLGWGVRWRGDGGLMEKEEEGRRGGEVYPLREHAFLGDGDHDFVGEGVDGDVGGDVVDGAEALLEAQWIGRVGVAIYMGCVCRTHETVRLFKSCDDLLEAGFFKPRKMNLFPNVYEILHSTVFRVVKISKASKYSSGCHIGCTL